jgi:hypothetical protein
MKHKRAGDRGRLTVRLSKDSSNPVDVASDGAGAASHAGSALWRKRRTQRGSRTCGSLQLAAVKERREALAGRLRAAGAGANDAAAAADQIMVA